MRFGRAEEERPPPGGFRGTVYLVCYRDGLVSVASPFAAKDAIKDLASSERRWDPDRKLWWIKPTVLRELINALNRAGFRIQQSDSDAPSGFSFQAPGGNPPPRASRTSVGGWAETLYDALPAHLREPAFKALLRVLHPDIGGDSRLTQQLNDAFKNRRSA